MKTFKNQGEERPALRQVGAARSSYAVTFTCVWPGHQSKEQRSSDYKTNKVSVTSFTTQDAIAPR